MSDISMCLNKKCPSAGLCYRFIAPVNEHRQAFMDFKPREGKDRCDDFIPVRWSQANDH